MVATTFRANLGSLGNDLLRIVHRKAATVWLIVSAWFNPAALFRREDTFIEWDDDAWLHVLQQVVDARRAKGIPSRGTSTLAALTREVKKLPRDNRTIAERIANARLFSSSDAQAKAEDGDLYKDATFRQVSAHMCSANLRTYLHRRRSLSASCASILCALWLARSVMHVLPRNRPLLAAP